MKTKTKFPWKIENRTLVRVPEKILKDAIKRVRSIVGNDVIIRHRPSNAEGFGWIAYETDYATAMHVFLVVKQLGGYEHEDAARKLFIRYNF